MAQTEKNKKVIILIGLPGSGKTTWAKEYLNKINGQSTVRIARDDFRLMLRNQYKTDPVIETLIDKLCENAIMQALKMGRSVIFDNTNLNVEKIEELCNALQYHADVEFFYMESSLKKCLTVNEERGNRRMEPIVIEEMNKKLLILLDTLDLTTRKKKSISHKPFIQPDFSSLLAPAVVFDIDGTLAILRGREPYDYDKVHKDDLNRVIADHAIMHHKANRKVLLVSGRDESCRNDTKDWLDLYEVPYTEIIMRKTGDVRRDAIVKKELYYEFVHDKFNVICVYDDRLEVVDMWNELGLFVLNVNQGNVIF